MRVAQDLFVEPRVQNFLKPIDCFCLGMSEKIFFFEGGRLETQSDGAAHNMGNFPRTKTKEGLR